MITMRRIATGSCPSTWGSGLPEWFKQREGKEIEFFKKDCTIFSLVGGKSNWEFTIEHINQCSEEIKETNMNDKNFISALVGDTKEFIRENRSVLYTIALLVIVDHFVFNGAFRERLKGLMSTSIDKVEKLVKGKEA